MDIAKPANNAIQKLLNAFARISSAQTVMRFPASLNNALADVDESDDTKKLVCTVN